MPMPHKSKIIKRYLDGDLIGYDLVTEFPAHSLSTLITVGKGIDHPSFSNAINNHMEAMNLRLLHMRESIMKSHDDMIFSLMVEETVNNIKEKNDEAMEDFQKTFRKSSHFAQKIYKAGNKILDELDDPIAKRLFKNFLKDFKIEDLKDDEDEETVVQPDVTSDTDTTNIDSDTNTNTQED